MLEHLAKDNDKWKRIALKICRDKMLADDVVQEMYLKLQHKDKVNDYYVILTLNSVFLDLCRKNKGVRLSETPDELESDTIFEADDREQEILNKVNALEWHQKEFLAESYSNSLRKIGEEFNINYAFIFREIKRAKEMVLK